MKLSSTGRVMMFACLGGICGCVPGYNSILFATKTNAGLVVDTQPPEVSIDIGRNEVLLAPSYEAGETPPVMASFRFDSEGFLSNYLGSVFTTGDAAVAMSRLYSADDGPLAGNNAWDIVPDAGANATKPGWKQLEERFDSAVPLAGVPQMPWFVPKEKPGAVRPLLFGTDTSFGFKVAWKNAQSPIPDYLRLGYQRRELAFAAVTVGTKLDEEGKPTDQLEARVPSLLATVDVGVRVREPWKSRFNYLQYFASGKAATALAFRREVRAAMLKRLDPEQGVEARELIFKVDYTCLKERDRLTMWLGDKDPVTVNAMEAGLQNAVAARDQKNPDDPEYSKLAQAAAAWLDLRVAAKILEEDDETLTASAVRFQALEWWIAKRGQQATVSIWVQSAKCDDIEEAIEYFDVS